MDLSEALDRVWHEGSLYKVKCNGIFGSILFSLLEAFLTDRQQRVVVKKQSSNWKIVRPGVLQ